ncbi:MAG: S-layer protein domain-containing protein [Methanolobus sp.]|nr:S-layer protein domain-containing protein [Methanolobus sp.]
MTSLKGTCTTIIAILIFLSMAFPVYSEPLFIKTYADPLIANDQKDISLINGTGIFLTTGGSWNFYQGYVLTLRSVNLEQKQVWLRLFHENDLLKEEILSEGDVFVYSKDNEILNITVDTIYVSPEGELITFGPVYQYLDADLPKPVIDEGASQNTGQDNEGNVPDDDNSVTTDGFTILMAFACISAIVICRLTVMKNKKG